MRSNIQLKNLIVYRERYFRPSLTSNDDDGSDSLDQYRTSTSSYINRQQTHLVRCLEKRFARFQGQIHIRRMEPFQVVKYIHSQQVFIIFHEKSMKKDVLC